MLKEACKTCLKEGCYALKSYRMYPAVRNAWDDNTDLAVNHLSALETGLNAYMDSYKGNFFRVHVGGDFVSAGYAAMWARIAENHPKVRFLAFTKQWDNVRNIEWPDNFSLVLSGWPGTEIPEDLAAKYPQAICVNGADEIPSDGMHCPGKCENCGMCWFLRDTGKNVYFVKH